MSKQQFFFVIGSVGWNEESITGYHSLGGGILDDINDQNVLVCKTEAEAKDQCEFDEYRPIKVHRDFLDVAAIPE